MQAFKVPSLLRSTRFSLPVDAFSVLGILLTILMGLFITMKSGAHLVYDEIYFTPNLSTFDKYGFTPEFFLNMQGQHPGPLYQIVHWIFKPITGYQIVAMRQVNFFLALGFVLLVRRLIIRLYGIENAHCAVFIIAIPMFWVVSGLALSEIPSMIVLLVSINLLVSVIKPILSNVRVNHWHTWLLPAISGLLLGFAVIGRTQFLMVAPCVVVFAFYRRRLWLPVLIFSAFSVVMPAYVFFTWQGLVPPYGQQSQSGFNFLHGLDSFAYASMMVLIIAPNWFQRGRLVLVFCTVLSLLFILLNLVVIKYEFLPMNTILQGFLNPMVVKTAAILFPAVFVFLAIWFISSAVVNVWRRLADPFYVVSAFSAFLILLTCVKSTFQFSSRYAFLAAPFLIILLAKDVRANFFSLARLVVGAMLGLASLGNNYSSVIP